jgi:hypothetical protein
VALDAAGLGLLIQAQIVAEARKLGVDGAVVALYIVKNVTTVCTYRQL